ncbi:MAG: hypothetical protein HYU48_01210 [Candidatus Levybacteria bacterium]|nr:hypothetical protein [Candidatus Levybacteria bacterium]
MPEGTAAPEVKSPVQEMIEAGDLPADYVPIAIRKEQQAQKTLAKDATEAAKLSGGEPVDPATRYDYSYHASPARSFDSVIATGLRARENAKERNTVWFNEWDNRDFYQPPDEPGILYRVKNTDLRKLDPRYDFDWSTRWDGPSNIEGSVPPEMISYSQDGGLSWKPLIAKPA